MIRLASILEKPIAGVITIIGTIGGGGASLFIERAAPWMAFLTVFMALVTGTCMAALKVRQVYRARKKDIAEKRAGVPSRGETGSPWSV